MRTFGLIGYPLSHSFSKRYFSEKFEKEGIAGCQYELFPIAAINLLPELIADFPKLQGLNVTIPHKVSVLPYLDEIDEAAAFIGAVNCISIVSADGKPFLKGYNTDAYGFEESLKPLLNADHRQALVFGDGGAAKAGKYVLEKLNIPYITVLRKESSEGIRYEDVTEALLETYTLLINTTPLGMSPNLDTCPPIPYSGLTEKHLAYDLVYNPEDTLFLRQSEAAGAATKNGLEMLHLQAERSWTIWSR